MKSFPRTWSSSLLFAAVLTLGCKKGEECDRARLAASDAWQTVTRQAGEARLKGWIGFDDLTEPKKAEHMTQWGVIETQSGLVSSSFTYEKITWKTADPAREKTKQAFDGYFAKDNFTTFAAALKTANQKYDAVSKVCRD